MEGLSLRELQLLVESQYTVQDSRKDLGRMVTFFMELAEQEMLTGVAFCDARKLPMELAKEHRVFFIPDDFKVLDLPEEFRVEALGMVRGMHVVYAGRLVYPVMDVHGDVMGLCGWDKFVQPKYLDSKNHGYRAKHTTLYGMEKLGIYYVSSEPIYVVEGIVDALYLRWRGLQSLALLGSSLHPYVVTLLRRFGRRLVVLPDNDTLGKRGDDILNPAGEYLVRKVKKLLPDATVVQSSIAKDIDEARKQEGVEERMLEELGRVCQNPYSCFQTLHIR